MPSPPLTYKTTAHCQEPRSSLPLSSAAHASPMTATRAHSRAFPEKQYANSASQTAAS